MVNLGAIDVISPDNGVEAVAFGEPVREAIDSAAVAGIQAEEVDAGDTIHGDVGAHVHLDKLREARDGGETTRMHVAHAKGDNTDPALPFKDIEGQDGWNEGAQRCGREGPV